MKREEWWNIGYEYYDTGDDSMQVKYAAFTVEPVTTAGGRIVSLTRERAEELAIREANRRHRPFYRLVQVIHAKSCEWDECDYG